MEQTPGPNPWHGIIRFTVLECENCGHTDTDHGDFGCLAANCTCAAPTPVRQH